MNNKIDTKKISEGSKKIINFATDAVGIALLKTGNHDMAYKVVTKGREIGDVCECKINEGIEKTADSINDAKKTINEKRDEVKTTSKDKIIKMGTEKAKDIAKFFKETVVNEINSFDAKKTTEKIKETINDKINIEDVKKSINEKVNIEEVKSKVTDLIKNKLEKRGVNLDNIEIDHTYDPFYDKSKYVEENNNTTEQFKLDETLKTHKVNPNAKED